MFVGYRGKRTYKCEIDIPGGENTVGYILVPLKVIVAMGGSWVLSLGANDNR